ncbi:MAG: non-homologous end-joining DNA ligase [Actinomycetota bacterium]
MSDLLELDGRTIEVGKPDKVLFGEAGITKRDLVDYYTRVAEWMLPHVRGRPLTMHRFPDGIEAGGFVQQQVSSHFPDWIRTVTVAAQEREVTHVVCDDASTLAYLADQAVITLHVWPATMDDLEAPDRLIFDLDPPEGTDDPAPVRDAAGAVRELLDELSLQARIMTTGSKGFHVVVPLEARRGFEEVRDFARRCAGVLAARHPDDLTTEQRIAKREGRVFVDYLRNAYGQTTVAPYAVRARPGAPVATPIDWKELPTTSPRSYTVANLFRRMGQKDDPWAGDGIGNQSLTSARETLESLEETDA